MKKNSIIAILLFFSNLLHSQGVGIGTDTPSKNAILELKASSKGFLPPRLTTIQRDSIANPESGLTIFNASANMLEYFNGSTGKWTSLQDAGTCSSDSLTIMDTVPNFNRIVVVYDALKCAAFYKDINGKGSWAPHTFGGSLATIQSFTAGGIIVLYKDVVGANIASGIARSSSGQAKWEDKPVTGTLLGSVVNKNFIILYTKTTVYTFYKNGAGEGKWADNLSIDNGDNLRFVNSMNNRVVLIETSPVNTSKVYGFTINFFGEAKWEQPTGLVILSNGEPKTVVSY